MCSPSDDEFEAAWRAFKDEPGSAPDTATVRDFLHTVTLQAKAATEGHDNPGLLQLSRLHPDSEELVPSRFMLDDVERMITTAVSDAENGHNVYIEGRLVRPGLQGKERGKLADTAAVFALVIDSDADKGMGCTVPSAVSLTVETSPGNFHHWFFLRQAVSAEVGKRLGERIRLATHCDHDTGTVTQPYRVAGTPNYPSKQKRARGRVAVEATRIVAFDPEVLWTPEDIEQAFPLSGDQTGGGDDVPPGGNESDIPPDTMQVIRDGVEEGERSLAFWNVIFALKRRGFAIDDVFTLLEQYPEGIAKKYKGRLRHEVERTWHKVKIEPGEREDIPKDITIASKADFLANFIPPDYLVEGILQRRFAYSLTAITGHGKTALALLLARTIGCADEAACFGSHAAEKGRIIYFVGENPDDVRCRIIGDDSTRSDDPSRDNVHFIVGVFDIEGLRAQLMRKIEEVGGADLVIIDTSAAYFLQEDENSNPQMHEHANRLRSLTTLPGAPCVVALCHPVKNASDPSQLVPRGGGSFLAAMDGNLTLWKHDDDLATLHHSPDKWRGPGFEPITFKLEKISTEKLVDSKGRQIPTVHAVAISDAEEKEQEANAERDEDQLLAVLGSGNRRRSITELAEACGWFVGNGEPHKSKVHRVLKRLLDAKLVKRVRGKYKLTKEGIEEAGLDLDDDDDDTVIDDRGGAISKEPFRMAQGARRGDTVPCMLCKLLGEVYKIADARLPKGKRHYADLHLDCAEDYFTGGRSTRPNAGGNGGSEDLF